MVESGYKFLIIRAWFCVNGGVDRAAITTHNNLRAAGMKHIGFYIFPCVGRASCPTAALQVKGVADLIAQNNLQADSVWLDIEGGGSCPWSTVAANKQFYVDFLNAAKATWPDRYGVYSSRYMWETLFGSRSWTNPGDSSVKLWYAHYDHMPSFSTFLTFSSWPTTASPYAKQYTGDTSVCGFNVDLNYAPEFFGLASSATDPTPPPSSFPCAFNAQPGKCTKTDACPAPAQWIASASGASGCGSLSAEWRCCVQVATTDVACNVDATAGTCVSTTVCAGRLMRSVPSSSGAKGCEALPGAIQCCVPPIQQQQQTSTNAASASVAVGPLPSTTLAVGPLPLTTTPASAAVQRSLSVVVDPSSASVVAASLLALACALLSTGL
jgi:hypothetical protein